MFKFKSYYEECCERLGLDANDEGVKNIYESACELRRDTEDTCEVMGALYRDTMRLYRFALGVGLLFVGGALAVVCRMIMWACG
jgi:hypothetical protein